MQGSKLPLTQWFLAIYLVSQAKTGLSALALKRTLGVSYPRVRLVQHKLMQAMASREQMYMLEGTIQIDDAYLGGEHSGGKAGRGSENKTPFVAAVSLSKEGHPLRAKLSPVAGFSLNAIEQWAKSNLAPVFTPTDWPASMRLLRQAADMNEPLAQGENPKSYPSSSGSTPSSAT
jgi:hypothetical protein